jgi:hypothetical protein
MKLNTHALAAPLGLLLLLGIGAQSAGAALPTLHLSAAVYGKHTTAGGTLSSHERLTQNGAHIGEDFSRCTPSSRTTVRCSGSYTLSGGTFQIAGTISNDSDTNRLEITGGTGRYRGARGNVLTEYNRTGTSARETITFK